MPGYTIRWANRSASNQDWQISNGDSFELLPNYVKCATVTINNDYTFQISVTTNGGVAAANLKYTAANQTWNLDSNTPNEWQLATGNNIVTVRCFLNDIPQNENKPEYMACETMLDNEIQRVDALIERPFILKRKIIGEQKTELDQVISDLPWLDGFVFGAGIDAITASMAGSAVKPFTPQQRTVKSLSEHYRFVQSDSELNREVEASASGKYNIEGVTINASASYLGKIKYSELIITLIAQYESVYDGYDEADSYELTDEATTLISEPDKFRKAYGDYFVAGGRRGSSFLAVYTCKATSVENMDEFKASFGGEAPEVFSAEVSTRFMQAASQHNISISLDLFMDGIQGKSPSGPWTPEKILNALKWFKAHEQGKARRAKLKHYSTIKPNYTRMIDVAPDVFVELRQLYTKVWDIRSLYASSPEYYRNQLKMDYTALDYGVVSNQKNLVTDKDKRLDYQKKADVLLSELSDVFARMDFYFKVKKAVGTEPSQNAAISEGKGQQHWLYGYSVYTKSSAVVINSMTLNNNQSGHVGWREHTFEFGPDGNYLIVGWQVISNWHDGTNGSWWKAINQILLTDQAAVHVKSKYGRGLDWSFVVYYVDAKDYQFSNE
jgi:hypothetical protein